MLKAVSLDRAPSFEDILNILDSPNLKSSKELRNRFKELVFDYSARKIPMFANCFNENDKGAFDFLKHPIRSNGQYFVNSNTQEGITTLYALNRHELYAFIERVKSFSDGREQNAKSLLDCYNAGFANNSCSDFEELKNYSKDTEKAVIDNMLNDFFSYYKHLIKHGIYYIAISMLILYSIINVNVVYLNKYLLEKVNYASIPETNLKCGREYVISSAINNNNPSFLTIEYSDEPLNENDTSGKYRYFLFAQKKTFLTYKNSVFTFEAASETENEEDDTDNDFGKRGFKLFGTERKLDEIMPHLITTGQMLFKLFKQPKLKKYYIKASNGMYLGFCNWHTKSRLGFEKVKTKKCKWIIETEDDGSITLIPSGGWQYYAFAVDIPNAIQKTNMIPMWLFVRNNTKAQKFKLHVTDRNSFKSKIEY